ncbi:MAG: hypothetical protein ACRDTM_06765 [Micromonosporaceae bacterium]
MSVFTVLLKNQPGELAYISELVADRGSNMMLCGVTAGSQGIIALVADDEDAARTALTNAGLDFNERDAITVRLPDEPGQAALFARRLADARVNIEILMPTRICEGQAELAVCVSDDAAARNALGDLVVS